MDFFVNVDKTKAQFYTKRRILPPLLSYNDQIIIYVKDQRLLGIYFDASRLTWKARTNYLAPDCCRRLDIMKAIASITYGASFAVLRNFYAANIRSKLGYCALAFSSASSTHLRSLASLENSCLHLMLGARKTTPIISLEVEGMIPPLDMDYNLQRTNYFTKLHCRPERNSAASFFPASKENPFVATCTRFPQITFVLSKKFWNKL